MWRMLTRPFLAVLFNEDLAHRFFGAALSWPPLPAMRLPHQSLAHQAAWLQLVVLWHYRLPCANALRPGAVKRGQEFPRNDLTWRYDTVNCLEPETVCPFLEAVTAAVAVPLQVVSGVQVQV